MNNIFLSCKVGTVFNPLRIPHKCIKAGYKQVRIRFPSRLNAMAMDPGKITKNQNMVFTPGEIVFSIKLYKTVEVIKTKSRHSILMDSIGIKRQPLIKHAVLLMKSALGIDDGLAITINSPDEIPHAGLGSSSSIIAAVSTAINELYGNPISPNELIRYLAQNHVEEIDNESDLVQQVQCIGGSAASGLYKGGLIVVAGESQVIKTMKIDDNYKVVIGIPSDYIPLDSRTLMKKEEENFSGFQKTSDRYRGEIAYRVLHNVLPSMNMSDLKSAGDLIYDYRFGMGSIENCSFVYPKLVELSEKLSHLKIDNIADVLSLSSVGPSFFAVTHNAEKCKDVFLKAGLNTFVVGIENNKYKVVFRK